MNWEQILGLEVPGLKTVQYLGSVSLQELQNAVAAAELEIRELEAMVAGLKAKAATLKKNPFEGLLDTGDSLTKAELFSKLKALQRKKNALNAEKAKLGLDISKFKVKNVKKVKSKETRASNQNLVAKLMDNAEDKSKFRYLESDTLMEVAMLHSEGFTPEESYNIAVYGKGVDMIDFDGQEEEERLF